MPKTDSGVMNGNTVKKALAEILGVLLMVLMGCMGCVPGWSHGPPNQFHRSFGFGMIVMCIIQTIGHVSGAHINPSVTLAALISRTISFPLAIVYILSHFIGAIIGYGLFLFITPNYAYNNETGFCGTSIAPDVTATQAVCVEMFITAVLIFVTCSVWDPWNAHQTETIPIKFAITFTVLAHTAGGYTGASMNPARSFAPALWNNEWKDHWVYWVGPLLGSTLAALFYQTCFIEGFQKYSRKIFYLKIHLANRGSKKPDLLKCIHFLLTNHPLTKIKPKIKKYPNMDG